MTVLLQPPNKEVDVAFLVFVERYATDLLKWDILAFFAYNANVCAPAAKIAERLGRSTQSIRPELGDLVLLGILDHLPDPLEQPLYRLTQEPNLRQLTLKFADQLAGHPPA